MSDTVWAALVVALSTLVGIVVTHWFNGRTDERQAHFRLQERQMEIDAQKGESLEQHRQWFERTVYERQLETVSHAWAFLMRLYQVKDNQIEQDALVEEVREWYALNQIYLTDQLGASNFTGVLNSAGDREQMDAAYRELVARARALMERASGDSSKWSAGAA